MTTHYTMYIGNDGAGGDTNLAALNFYNEKNFGSDDLNRSVAYLVGYAQYLLPATGTYVQGVSAGPAGGHGQFPQIFPDTEYGILEGADDNLVAMTDWGVRYGFNNLTALGIGAVLTKKTTKVGRHGRGRLTSPWLPVSAVTATGSLLSASATAMANGWQSYMGPGFFAELLKNASETPYLPIVNATVSTRLGHVRSRTK